MIKKEMMDTALTAPAESLEKRTLSALINGLESGKSAGLTQVINLVQDITARAETISVGQLAEAVSHDLATMTRVLEVANTMGYNPTSSGITTVPQAIQIIGFDKIRNIAIALLLLDHAGAGNGTEGKQNVAAYALTSGLISQSLLQQRPAVDAEHAFVCTALRSYGELLVSTFLPEEHAKARSLVNPQRSWNVVCREVFGLTMLEVAREILSRSQLPKSLLSSLRPCTAELITAKGLAPSDLIIVASDYASRLCDCLIDSKSSGRSPAEEAAKLAKEYGKTFADLEPRFFEEMLEQVARQISSFAGAQGTGSCRSPLIRRLASIADPEVNHASQAPQKSLAPGGTLDAVLAELPRNTDGTAASLRVALNQVLVVLQQELALIETVVFFKDEVLPTWSARLGNGTLFSNIRSQPLLSEDAKNIFTICLTRGEDVFVQNPSEDSIKRFVPEWLRASVQRRPLLLISLTDAQGTYAVICGVGDSQQSIRRANKMAKPLRELKIALAKLSRVEVGV